jgi:hypothetical protein
MNSSPAEVVNRTPPPLTPPTSVLPCAQSPVPVAVTAATRTSCCEPANCASRVNDVSVVPVFGVTAYHTPDWLRSMR